MTDYGKGSVLGAATTLPATSALGFVLADKLNPVLLVGFISISLVSLFVTLGFMSRYLRNRKG